MLISHKGHTDNIQVYSVTVMIHVKALQAGHSSQGTSEPITPVYIAYIYMHSSNFQMTAMATPSGGEHITQVVSRKWCILWLKCVCHTWPFSLPYKFWPWMTLKGQTKVFEFSAVCFFQKGCMLWLILLETLNGKSYIISQFTRRSLNCYDL